METGPVRRSPLKRGTKPMRQVSEKRSAEKDDYDDAKAKAWSRDRGTCQAGPDRMRGREGWPEIECGGRADPHHVAPVGQYPELRCDPANLLTLCRAHHDGVHHQDPVKARELGLLI